MRFFVLTVEALQVSAFELLDRMIDCREVTQ